LRPECEEPFSLRQIKALIWTQAAVGIALFFGCFWALFAGQGLVLLGVGVCVVGWIVSFKPLAARARRIDRRQTAPSPAYHDLLLILWGTAQFGSICFDLVSKGESFLINLASNFLLLLLLVLRGWMSIRMQVPISRSTWYWAMAIAGTGFLIRASLVVLLLLSWPGC